MKRIVLFMILLFGMISTGYAQATVDPALIDTVTQAFEQTRASTSLHVVTQSLTERGGGGSGGAGGGGFGGGQQQGQAVWDMALNADGEWNVAGSQTTLMQIGENQIENMIQTIVVDGVTYLNMDGAQIGQFGGQGGGTTPQGWFEMGADGADPSAGQPFGGMMQNAAQQAFGGLLFPINAESVTAIRTLPDDTIDGQAMHVYQIRLDAQAVIDSDASILLNGGGGGFASGQPPQGFAPDGTPPAPEDGQFTPPTDGQFPDGAQELDPANVTITFAVYVGQADGLVHRIYSVIETAVSTDAGDTVTTTRTSVTDFSAFDQPVEIAAPDVST